MQHAVETHPQRDQIIAALSNDIPVRKIAATLTPPLHYTALQRYKMAKVAPAQRNAHLLAKVLGKSKALSDLELDGLATATAVTALQAQPAIDPYLSRIAQHRGTIDRAILDAQADQDGRTIAALISTDLKGLELDGRFTGRLDGPSGSGNTYYILAGSVSVGVPAAAERPAIDVTPPPDLSQDVSHSSTDVD